MTMNERNRLIEQYMSGDMTIHEEEAFHLLVQSDERLRHMLEAERIIRSAMEQSRRRIPTDHSRMRTDALRLVASTPPAGPAAAPAAARPGLFSGATGIAVIATCVILIMGAFIFRMSIGRPEKAAPPSPAVMTPATQQEPAPVHHVQPATPAPAMQADSMIIEEPATPRPYKRARALKPKQMDPREKIGEEHVREIHDENRPPVILRNDTLRARLNIEQLQQR